MDLRISSRHATAPEDIREYVVAKLEPLGRFNRHARALDVVLDEDHLLKHVEVRAQLDKGAPLVVHSKHEDWRASIDAAHDKMETALRRQKERLNDRRKKGTATDDERLAEAFRFTGDETQSGEVDISGE